MTESSERVLSWLREVAVERSERVVPVPGGTALLHAGYPDAHDHNRLLLWSSADGESAWRAPRRSWATPVSTTDASM